MNTCSVCSTEMEREGKVCSNKCAGSMGGKVKVPKGFALMTPKQRSAAGKKGGSISRVSR